MKSFLFDAEKLAKMNNRLGRFLNRNFNHCQIDAYVPASMKLLHNGFGVIIGKFVQIGENVTVYHNVTIGQRSLKKRGSLIEVNEKDYPIIGDNVIIGCGSIILGKIKIGKNSIIGAGSFIDKDTPKNSVIYNNKKINVKRNRLVLSAKK